jgi:hypothetical protein
LHSTDFAEIVNNFGMPEMDLFASRLNYKVIPFCSYQPDPLAHIIDAFTVPWSGFLGYAFPPFCLLGRVLQKIVQDKALVIVVAPDWPTKSCYTLFRRLQISQIHRIYVTDSTLFLSHRLDPLLLGDPRSLRPHPLAGKLVLTVELLSGSR